VTEPVESTLFERARDEDSIGKLDPRTDPGREAFKDQTELFSFVGFVAGLALRADEVVKIARGALRETTSDEEHEPEDVRSAVATLRLHGGLLLQMTLSRAVDSFLTYLSELIALLYKTRPETLRANIDSETDRGTRPLVPLDLILEHRTMDDLVGAIVERRVSDLSYKGLPDLSVYLEKRLGFRLFVNESDRDEAIRIVESRNVIVHNRGRVNQTYVSRVASAATSDLGKDLPLGVESLFHDTRFLAHVTADVDARAIEKWSLPEMTGT
jgi:uncharacterized protein YutE (UPF0331/DUF86 family)